MHVIFHYNTGLVAFKSWRLPPVLLLTSINTPYHTLWLMVPRPLLKWMVQDPMVQTLNSAIQRINHYPAEVLGNPIPLSAEYRFIQRMALPTFWNLYKLAWLRMPAQLFLPRNACNPNNTNDKLLKRVTDSQKQTTEIYSHCHSNLISTILCTYTDTPPDIHANLKPQSNEFG